MTFGTLARPATTSRVLDESTGWMRRSVTCPWCGYERQKRARVKSDVCRDCAQYEQFANRGGLDAAVAS